MKKDHVPRKRVREFLPADFRVFFGIFRLFPEERSRRRSSNDISPHAAQGRGAAARHFHKSRPSDPLGATQSCDTARQGKAP